MQIFFLLFLPKTNYQCLVLEKLENCRAAFVCRAKNAQKMGIASHTTAKLAICSLPEFLSDFFRLAGRNGDSSLLYPFFGNQCLSRLKFPKSEGTIKTGRKTRQFWGVKEGGIFSINGTTIFSQIWQDVKCIFFVEYFFFEARFKVRRRRKAFKGYFPRKKRGRGYFFLMGKERERG